MPTDHATTELKQSILLSHVLLIGLTPLIPLPFIDDYARSHLQRLLVRKLANASGVDLTPADIAVLADDRRGKWKGRVIGLAFAPMRKIFKKTFLVLGIKALVDGVSIAWHRAFLIDHALEKGWCAPNGPHDAMAVRSAIDAVCQEVPNTPLEPALRAAFNGSKSALQSIGETYARLLGRAGPTSAAVDAAMDEAASSAGESAPGLVDRIRQKLEEVPEAHRDRLRSALDRRIESGYGVKSSIA